MSRDYRLYLDDMKECCEKVIRYVNGMDLVQFLSDEKTYDAVLRNLEIIGEAANHVPEKVQDRYASVDWSRVIGFRNIVAHRYFGVDEEILWNIITVHVPKLLEHLEPIVDIESHNEP